jgi:hypothetical protein
LEFCKASLVSSFSGVARQGDRGRADRLEIHRLRYGSPVAGPIFANSLGKPLALSSAVNRIILPVLNRCEACGKTPAAMSPATAIFPPVPVPKMLLM